jgi:hypothetical protein
MADGETKPIKDVKAGDEVKATDPETGKSTDRTVEKLITTKDDKDFATVTIKDGKKTSKITATVTHPFWSTTTHRWIDAGNLKPHTGLRTATGASVAIVAVHIWHHQHLTHDLTVNTTHTYYVLAGATPVLVHNCDNAPVVLHRSPGTGKRASEANGLNAANHGGDHPTAYLSNLPEGAAHYAGNGHDLGMHVFTMKPGFREAFGRLEFPLENSMGLTQGLTEWRIPASRFDEFNSYIDHDSTEWWDAADGHFFSPSG